MKQEYNAKAFGYSVLFIFVSIVLMALVRIWDGIVPVLLVKLCATAGVIAIASFIIEFVSKFCKIYKE